MTWINPPSSFTQTVRGDVAQKQKRLALVILRNLTLVSPKDTGRFINNWVVGLGSKKVSTLDSTDPARVRAFARGEAIIKQHKLWRSIWISNNLPYAERLNDGWSGQAPANFVQSTVARASK